MPIPLPTSCDVRKIRTRAAKASRASLVLVRAPALAWVGFNDLVVAALRELSGERLLVRADKAAETAGEAYDELAGRGELRVERFCTQPSVAWLVSTVEDFNVRTLNQVGRLDDHPRDADHRLRNSAGNRTTRTQRLARDVATNIAEGRTELPSRTIGAGVEAARDIR